jgi:sporulation protein YlmC with PRC-barrel domain
MSSLWNPTTHTDYDAIKGRDVYTSNNEKIGTVDQVLHAASASTARDQHYFLVKPGLLDKLGGQDELYIPATAVDMVSEDRIVIGMTSAALEVTDWSRPTDADSFRYH